MSVNVQKYKLLFIFFTVEEGNAGNEHQRKLFLDNFLSRMNGHKVILYLIILGNPGEQPYYTISSIDEAKWRIHTRVLPTQLY